MASAFQRLRSMLSPTSSQVNAFLDPEIGFKVTVNENTRELKVIVIGARHLPTLYGLTKADGYIIKVKLFPGREKFETSLKKESWPMFNQEFVFELPAMRRLDEQLNGCFIVLTVYAILEAGSGPATESDQPKPLRLSSQSFRSFFGGARPTPRSERVSLHKRRTVGAVTYKLDAKAFTNSLRGNSLGTPDVWRVIRNISSGLLDTDKTDENNKGSVELTLTYSESENGENDMFTVNLSRLRFSIQTMETHEHYTGSLYVKMKIIEDSQVVSKWKSDKFEPTISRKFEASLARVVGTVRRTKLPNSSILVQLMCRNKLGKKTELGTLSLTPGHGHWEQCLDSPAQSKTLWHNFR